MGLVTAWAAEAQMQPDVAPTSNASPVISPPPSIRARMTWLLLVLAAVSALGVALAVWVSVRHEVGELLDQTLEAASDVLCTVGSGTAAASVGRSAPSGELEFAWQAVRDDGTVLARSPGAPDQAWADAPRLGAFRQGPWHVHGARCGPATLYVAQAVEERLEAELEVALTAAGAAVVAGMLCAGWLGWRLRRELHPIEELSRQLETFDPAREGSDLQVPQRRELVPVMHAIDRLARRLHLRATNERAFAGQAAHVLRTPLAGLQVQLAVAQREAPAALQPRLMRIGAAAAKLQRVVEALLLMFRAGDDPRCSWVDLPTMLRHLAPIELAIDVADGSRVWADADLLAAALINLLENAARHGATRVHVSTTAPQDPAMQCVHVDDNGRGMTDAQRVWLQSLLRGEDASPLPGQGLLLADRVARAHGGRLELPPADGTGCRVRLLLGPPTAPSGAV
ncbi:MAG: sensor histidine kinase, partial [Aquabacterium sp.]